MARVEMESLKFGVVIHGPEAIDTGLAIKVIQTLTDKGEVEACVGGATGIIAAIDACLERIIDISKIELPSEALSRLDPDVDYLVLVNCGKIEETGIEFGRIVSLRSKITKPLIQVDCEFVAFWDESSMGLARWLAESMSKKLIKVVKGGLSEKRRLKGVLKGENILINGVVIGKALTDSVEIWKDCEGKLHFSGIEIKKHVLDRIGEVDLSKSIIRSGFTRRTQKEPRTVLTDKNPIACLINHNAERLAHEYKHASAVVSVGDDTTKNAGNILRRYGVPIIGITDGDEDGICKIEDFAPGSVVFVLKTGTDDQAGEMIKEKIFNGRAEIPFEDLEALERQIASILNEKIKMVKRYRS